jgi:hypothetical protein
MLMELAEQKPDTAAEAARAAESALSRNEPWILLAAVLSTIAAVAAGVAVH